MRERTALRLAEEQPKMKADKEAVQTLDRVEGLLEWERDLLVRASERVFRYGRALMERQRTQVHEIIQRRTAV